MKVEMGSRVRDGITGIEGIVVGYAHHLTGCDTVGIGRTGLDKDGKAWRAEWVDVTRVEVLGGPPEAVAGVIAKGHANESGDKPGGPQDAPRSTRDNPRL